MRLKPFTLEHFREYTKRMVLDNGDNWYLEDFQVEVVEPILAGVKEVWTVIPEGNGKHLSVDMPIPTPDGWTTMLELHVGQEVLGSDGQPTKVTWAGPVEFGRDCFRITFSDGAQIVASGEHLWEVEDAQDHYNATVRTTNYMANRPLTLAKKGRSGSSTVARWRIQTGCRQAGPEVELPISPYVLGAWLGDGASSCGRITNIDQEVWNRIESSYEVGPHAQLDRARTHTVYGLKVELRAAGLLGNKHIPAPYLIASEDDRWELLQGLIDTDGTVSQAGQVTYTTISRRLAADVRRLVWSLGLPCTLNQTRSVLNGTDYGGVFDLTISCDARHPVASLPRKLRRLKSHGLTCDHRRIVSIEPVTSVPVKCIQVEARNRLYLAGEAYVPTHNTTLMAGVALYHADFTRAPWVPIAASSRDQAEILARQAYQIIRASPGFLDRFKIYEGYREIRNNRTGGRGIKVYAADTASGDGVIPTLALCDEGHRWPDLSVYRLWKGKLGKRAGQIVMISTAGAPGEEFEEQRDTIRNKALKRYVNGAHIKSVGGNIVMNEWRVEKEEFIADMARVKDANPFSGITEETLLEDFESPTTDLGDWKRLKCNIPSRTSSAAITENEWDRRLSRFADIPEGEHVDVGVDVAWKHDTFAIVPLWQNHSEVFNLLGKPTILIPPRDGSMLPVDDVKAAFIELNDRNPIEVVVIDMERAEDVAQWLEDEFDVEIIDRPQGNANQVEDYDSFMEGLRSGKLQHTGDSELRKHVMNAIARQLPGDKKRFDRPSQSRAKRKQVTRVIDALTAAAMVNHQAGQIDAGEPLVAWG